MVGRLGRFAIARSLALSLTAAGVASCVLLVAPDDYGPHCRFAGQDSVCGQCIAQKCGAQIDDCCRTDACAPGLALIERCASGDRQLCGIVESDLQASDPHRVELARCVSTQCKVTCTTGVPASITKCAPSSFGLGKTCSCAVTADPNVVACSESAFAETRCCAPASWPAAGQKCACQVLACTPTADGCACTLYDGPAELSTCNGPICCLDADTCRCGSKPCGSLSTPVDSCTLATIGCPPSQKHVTTCTATAAP
jgi:hypothetical protein